MTLDPATQPTCTGCSDLGDRITNRTQLGTDDSNRITRTTGGGCRLLDHCHGNTTPRKLMRYARASNASADHNRF